MTVKSHFGLSLYLGVILALFTSCEPYQEQLLTQSSTLACEGEACIVPKVDNLQVKTQASEIYAGSGTKSLDIGGDCNEAGYMIGRIEWVLVNQENQPVQGIWSRLDSDFGDEYTIASEGSLPGNCSNGRFYINVPLFLAGASSSVLGGAPHRLVMRILGMDTEGKLHENSFVVAKDEIKILPLAPPPEDE